MPEIVESKQYELFCNEQMIKSEFRQMWANKKRQRAFIVKMPEIVESKQYELFCNEQMIKSEFRQMWANKKRRNISHLRGSVLGCTPK